MSDVKPPHSPFKGWDAYPPKKEKDDESRLSP